MSALSPSDAVRRTMLALSRGDVEAFLDGLCEDVEWHGGGVLLPRGVFRGREAVRSGLGESEATRGRLGRVIHREVTADSHDVLLLGVIERRTASGYTTMPNSFVCELRGERVQRVTAYTSDAAARAAWAGRS
jgi:ketosteroid isomerase-like protein